MGRVVLEIHTVVAAAYVRLEDAATARTVEMSDSILVDLDEFDMVVGFEILDIQADIPLRFICEKFHIRTGTKEVLKRIHPSLQAAVKNPNGESHGTGATHLTFA